MAKPQLAARCDSPADAARRMRGYRGRFVVESKFDGERMMVRCALGAIFAPIVAVELPGAFLGHVEQETKCMHC